MLAFKVLTLSYFYLCVCWHFFILVPPVMTMEAAEHTTTEPVQIGE